MDDTTTTLAGTGVRSHEDGPAATAGFAYQNAVLAVPEEGPIFVAEHSLIQKIRPMASQPRDRRHCPVQSFRVDQGTKLVHTQPAF